MKRAFSILLTVLILSSSLNFNLSAHYCGKRLVDFALWTKADTCSKANDNSCEVKKPCCSDLNFTVEVQDFLTSKKEVKQEKVNLTFPTLSNELLAEYKPPKLNTIEYSPPLIEQDIIVHIQSFLL